MALINCPECGHQMSDTAKKCPNCGYSNNKFNLSIVKPFALGGLLSIVGLFITILSFPVMSGWGGSIDPISSEFYFGCAMFLGGLATMFLGCKKLKPHFRHSMRLFVGIATLCVVSLSIYMITVSFYHFEEYSIEATNFYEKGVEALNQKDYDQAYQLFIKASEQGNAKAMNDLGVMYSEGVGIAQDYSKAFEWFNKAAQLGLPVAQFSVGVAYQYGEGVSADMTKAVEWYTKSAEQGYAAAQFNLGEAYYFGDGVLKDIKTAYQWYGKSAQQGYAKAEYALGMAYYTGEMVEQSYANAFQLFMESAKQGYDEAQYAVGLCYSRGQGVEQNTDTAIEWYRKAAEQGNKKALKIFQ